MICGDRIGLRPVLEEDLELIGRWRKDPSTRAMFCSPFLLSETALLNWYKGLLGDSARLRFMIQRLTDGEAIGIVGLEHIQYRNQEGELAGLLIDPAEYGHGWATKAVLAMTRYSFEDLNLHRVFARIYGSNSAARRVAEKVGLKCEGTARQAVFHNWRYEDVIYFALLSEEWRDGTSSSPVNR